MRIVVAMDSFKGSLTSLEAGNAVRDGIMKADPSACVTVCPMADGGEGTVEALRRGLGGDTVTVRVMGPLGAGVAPHTAFCRTGAPRSWKWLRPRGLRWWPHRSGICARLPPTAWGS